MFPSVSLAPRLPASRPIRAQNGHSGPRDRRAASRAARGGSGGGSRVYTVSLSSSPTVVKSAADSPFSQQASSEKLIDAASLHRSAVKRSFLLFLAFKSAGEAEASVLGRVFVK